VAGLFYPEKPQALKDLITDLLRQAGSQGKRERAVAVVVPHGPYRLSGAVAAAVYAQVRMTETVVIVGPPHSGSEQGIATAGVWETPGGQLPVDRELARAILKSVGALKKNPKAHEEEHSIEVQLPFLRHLGEVRRFVPVLIAPADPETLRGIGRGIARALRSRRQEATLICSTQLTRYEPDREAQRKDAWAIQALLDLDEERLLRGISEQGLSLCGAAPAVVVLSAAKTLGASRAVLVRHEVSNPGGGEPDSVVGYAGVVVR